MDVRTLESLLGRWLLLVLLSLANRTKAGEGLAQVSPDVESEI